MHQHDWNLIDNKLIKSAYTLGIEQGMSWAEASNVPPDFYVDRYVLTFKCDCGKIRIEER